MSTLSTFLKCLTSPKLKKIYRQSYAQIEYKPNNLEQWSDSIINSLHFIWNFSLYTSPFIAGFMYKKGYGIMDGFLTTSKLMAALGVALVLSMAVRSIGRLSQPEYLRFLTTLSEAKVDVNKHKKQLMQNDFDFSAWPVEFRCDHTISSKSSNVDKSKRSAFDRVINLPLDVIAYIAISTFGIRMIYPGSISFIQTLLDQNLVQGRAALVERHKGERFKLQSRDKNDIDVMFIDKRDKNRADTTNILVVCSEGNAGFYEIGLMCTPLDCGEFSVLGWNHPGFAGSTGKPYPNQEQSSIDAVMQFAIEKLGFLPENIILFGWSIGGYATTWAAMNYPEVRGVVLDATFDDLVPLAVQHMPIWMSSLVMDAVRNHVNLNVAEQLQSYPGPVSIIRRTQDEIICTREGDISTNRGNYLVIKLMQHRYPLIFAGQPLELVREYLGFTSVDHERMLSKYRVDEEHCTALLQSYVLQESKSYPMLIGDDMSDEDRTKLALFLVNKYLNDFNSTHCTALPGENFHMPWDVPAIETDYVLIK